VLCVGHLVAYTKLGYGAAHSGMYLNALQQPWAVAENLVIGVPLYLCSALLAPLAGLAVVLSCGVWLLAIAACLVLAALAPWILPVLRTNKHARFFALSACASILPLSGVPPQDRLAFMVGFGSCGLLSVILTPPLQRFVPRALFHLHTSCALLLFVPLSFVCSGVTVGGAPWAINAALSEPADRDVVVLNIPVETVLASVDAIRRKHNAELPRSLRALYVGGASYDVQRVDAHTIDMQVQRGWFSNVLERLAREPREEPFAAGDLLTTDMLTARVLEVNARGAPLRVRFQFIRPLEDPRWLWLRLDGARVLAWTPPAIGEAQYLGAAGSL
jgi:hypothetical protein